MTQQNCSAALSEAIRDRGRIYLAIFRELKNRYGEAEAVSVMRAASRARGIDVGRSLACLAPRDFDGVFDGFFIGPNGGELYTPVIRQQTDQSLEVKMMTCPLKESWVEAGCSDDEICTLLHCASAFDEATFKTAGFDVRIETWAPGRDGCCLTRVSEKASGADT